MVEHGFRQGDTVLVVSHSPQAPPLRLGEGVRLPLVATVTRTDLNPPLLLLRIYVSETYRAGRSVHPVQIIPFDPQDLLSTPVDGPNLSKGDDS